MSRIKRTFSSLKEQGKQALIAYLVAGVPNIESTVSLMHLMTAKGVNILELGVAFSDPMSEGPLIQAAHEKALDNDVTIERVFYIVKKFRKKDNNTPIILMGYTNTFEAMGVGKFCAMATEVGVDGLLLVDMPFEESSEFFKAAKSYNIDIIRLIAPTTNPERVKKICLKASGYIYYISLKGITGAASFDPRDVKEKIKTLKETTNLPIAIGFGIKSGAMVRKIKNVADGVVVGSALVEIISGKKNRIKGDLSRKLNELVSSL